MRNTNIQMTTTLSGFNINLPHNIKTAFSQAKTGRELRQSLCRGARAIARQLGTYRTGIRIVKPVCEIIKTSLGNAGMTSQAAELGEAVVTLEEGAAVAATDSVILSAEAEALLATAETGTVISEGSAAAGVIGGGVSVAAGVAIGVGAGVIILIAVCWLLGSNHVAPDKRSLLNQELSKLFRDFKQKS